MIRWVSFLICILFGLGMIFMGLQVPAHLRAVDVIVLQTAGRGTPSLTDHGLALVKSQRLGAAQLFLAAASSASLADAGKLSEAVDALASSHPELGIPGQAEPGPLGDLLQSGRDAAGSSPGQLVPKPEAFTEFIVRSDRRTKALALLPTSSNSLGKALLDFRTLTNTVLFPPSASASGQALDAAIALCGLLTEAGHLSTGLSNAVLGLAMEANQTGNPQPLEQALMDLLSLGQRFNWGQLATFVEPIHDPETLGLLSNLVRRGDGVPVIYAAVALTGNAAGVASYLTTFGETGLNDLRAALAHGTGGVNELLARKQRLCNSSFCERMSALTSSGTICNFAVDYSRRAPGPVLAVKWLLYFIGGFLLATAIHRVRRVTTLEQPLVVRGFHVVREILFALGFLVVVLLLSEPFLAQGSQKVEFSFRLRLPTVGGLFRPETQVLIQQL